jgi:hypothetical protein
MQALDNLDLLLMAAIALLVLSGVIEFAFGARRLAQATWLGTLVIAVFFIVSLFVRLP